PMSPSYPVLPQPARSALFPYTTLFRSRVSDAPGHIDEGQITELAIGTVQTCGELRRQLEDQARALGGELAEARIRHLGQLALLADRKSTRLNSSHVKISYAVFCLKKKK